MERITRRNTERIAIRGEGIAGYCCGALLQEQSAELIGSDGGRARLPAVLISEGTQRLLLDIFRDDHLFEGLPRIRKRIVAWDDKPAEAFSHSAVIVAEQVMRQRLRAKVSAEVKPETKAADWTIFTAKAAELQVEELRCGSRVASVVEVTLADSADKEACWAESTDGGWVFLIATGDGKGSLICTGGEPQSLLARSRVIGKEVGAVSSEAGEFPAYPRIASPLYGENWLACGAAAMFFDPLSGEGTGNAVRQAILAAASVRAILRGEPADGVLGEFSLRMRLGFLRHLEICREFYRVKSEAAFWREELAMLESGIVSVKKEIEKQSAPRYRLVDFDLARI